MGNSFGGKMVKVMKIDGETFKLKTPVEVRDVVKDFPGHVLIESEAVRHLGIRAKPLEPQQELNPKRLYFLVELPKLQEEKVPRRVQSGIHMSAKDRLESLMLSRRSISDLSIMKPTSLIFDEPEGGRTAGTMRVRIRLPKAQVAELVKKSIDAAEAAEKIMELCIESNFDGVAPKGKGGLLLHQQTQSKTELGRITDSIKTREKRVCFLPIKDEEFVH